MESMIDIKIPPNDKMIQLEKYTENQWDFYWRNGTMMPSKEMDALTKEMKVTHLPEMFFGYNRMLMVNQANNFLYEINPLDMMNLTSYSLRKEMMSQKMIYYEPQDAKVQFHSTWKDMKIDRDDIQVADPKADWSYASSYMGSFSSINASPLAAHYNKRQDDDAGKKIEVVPTDMKMPLDRLGPNNPILKYIEVCLYDDELNDNGLSEAKLRFRVMKDCFFGLLRSYIRVDNVMIRVIDTRIFHSFGDDYILRNFVVKEATYDHMKSIGFECCSSWSMSPNQSDVIAKQIEVPVIDVSDKVMI